MDLGGRWVGYTFGAIGVGLFIVAGFLYRADNQLALDGETALGTVVDFRWVKGGRRATGGVGNDASNFHHYREPIIRFQTRRGETVQFPAIAGTAGEGINTGDTIEVVYLPSNPSGAEVKGSTRLSDAAIVFLIMGSACLIPTVYLNIVPALRRRRRTANLARISQEGKVIKAKVNAVRRIHPKVFGGIYSIRVVADWRDPATGKLHEFLSDVVELDTKSYAKAKNLPVWVEPSRQMVAEIEQKLQGRGLRVRINPDHPDQYVMDPIRLPGMGAD